MSEELTSYLKKVRLAASAVPTPDGRPLINTSDEDLSSMMNNATHPLQDTAYAEALIRLDLEVILRGYQPFTN